MIRENWFPKSAKMESAVVAVTLFLSGCSLLGPDDGPAPPPAILVAVEAACNACTPTQATHPCPPRPVGTVLCSGIPTIRVGETMILCARGTSGAGPFGRLEWSSSDAQVASVRPANLTVIHCVNELGNAVFDAKRPGMTIVTVKEIRDGRVAGSALAPVTVVDTSP
jgi:hypothetical protein